MQQNQVLLLGQDPRLRALVGKAAGQARQQLRADGMLDPAQPVLQADDPPLAAIVVNMDEPDIDEVTVAVRSRAELAKIPMIGVTQQTNDLIFAEAFGHGMDDCCGFDEQALVRRLRHVGDVARSVVSAGQRSVVVADGDAAHRLLIGRIFQGAGYHVMFAVSAEEALSMSTDDRVTAVIVTEAIDEKGVSGDRLCRHIFALEEGAAERRPAWVFNTTPKGIPGMLGRLQGEQSVRMAVHDAFASPSSLLFVVNELLNQDAKDARKSERLLYSTAIRFRPAGRGRQTEDLGCCYNISEGGLYVRTLAPPEPWTELWLEFTPPRSDRIVHLEATAVWTRAYGPAGKATAPSGFGVQLVGGSAADVERYTLGCKALVEERAARLLSTRPPAV